MRRKGTNGESHHSPETRGFTFCSPRPLSLQVRLSPPPALPHSVCGPFVAITKFYPSRPPCPADALASRRCSAVSARSAWTPSAGPAAVARLFTFPSALAYDKGCALGPAGLRPPVFTLVVERSSARPPRTPSPHRCHSCHQDQPMWMKHMRARVPTKALRRCQHPVIFRWDCLHLLALRLAAFTVGRLQ